MCSLTTGEARRGSNCERAHTFCYYRMCSLTTECVLLLQVKHAEGATASALIPRGIWLVLMFLPVAHTFCYYRMCSLTIECVLLP